MRTISKKYMMRAKSILNFSIFSLAGALIGFIFSTFLLDNDEKSVKNKLINAAFSYNYAVEKASPAVVNIYSAQIIDKQLPTKKRFNSIFNTKGRQVKTSLGSGVILSSDGYVLTNQHVVGDNSLRVTTELYDGRKYIAQLIGIDKGTDLAVLKIQDDEILFPSIEIEDSDKVNIGDIVLAIGNPYGLGQSVSMGIVSATGREFDNPYSNYIQTDASINRGNSGGALIDSKGRLIGINTLIRSSSGGSEGIGLAIPSTNALEIISDLIQYGEVRRGWLGFSIERINLLRKGQLVISEVVVDGPAYRSGLLKGDIINSINSESPSYDNLYKTFARSKPGEEILLKVKRGPDIINLTLITGQAD